MILTLPQGSCCLRADHAHPSTGDNVQFWSDVVDHCPVPGCLEVVVEVPGGAGQVNAMIDYAYDPLRAASCGEVEGAVVWLPPITRRANSSIASMMLWEGDRRSGRWSAAESKARPGLCSLQC